MILSILVSISRCWLTIFYSNRLLSIVPLASLPKKSLILYAITSSSGTLAKALTPATILSFLLNPHNCSMYTRVNSCCSREAILCPTQYKEERAMKTGQKKRERASCLVYENMHMLNEI